MGIWVLASEASSNLLAAREMMAFTLGFHILLVPLGVALPAITLIANWRGVRKRDEVALLLARRWSKVMAVTFAVGAITGTVLSFELGLLWPGLMGKFGDVFGLGFNIEASAFFLEAILIAIYIYGWDRLSPRAHLWTGVPIPFVSMLGAASIVAANSWLNTPQGFTLGSDGLPKNIDVGSAIFTPAFPWEFAHMIIAAYLGAGFLVASVYAVGMLRGRNDRYHRLGFLIPFTIAAILTPVQLLVGDQITRMVIREQPVKFAAIEGVQQSGTHESESLFGYLPGNGQDDNASIEYAISIPNLASFLAGGSADTEIKGLDTVETRRPAAGEHRALGVRRHGVDRFGPGIARPVVRLRVVATETPPEDALVPPVRGSVRCRAPGHDRGGLGRHRSRPTTMDRLQRAAHKGCGHRPRRHLGLLRAHRRAVPARRGGIDHRAPGHGPSVARSGRVRRLRRPLRAAWTVATERGGGERAGG